MHTVNNILALLVPLEIILFYNNTDPSNIFIKKRYPLRDYFI